MTRPAVDPIDLSDQLQTAKEYATILVMAAADIDDRKQMNAVSRIGYDLVDMIEGIQRLLEGGGDTA